MSKAPANLTGLTIAYTARPDATPERELNALVAVYRFIFSENSASKEGAPENAMKGSKDDRARSQFIK